MLSTLVETVKEIGQALAAIWDFVWELIKGFAEVLQLLGRVVGALPQYLIWLPSTIVAITLAIFTVVIIYKVTGREG